MHFHFKLLFHLVNAPRRELGNLATVQGRRREMM